MDTDQLWPLSLLIKDPAGPPLSSVAWYRSLGDIFPVLRASLAADCAICQFLTPPPSSLPFSPAGTLLSCKRGSGCPCPQLSYCCPVLHPLPHIWKSAAHTLPPIAGSTFLGLSAPPPRVKSFFLPVGFPLASTTTSYSEDFSHVRA